MRIEHHNGRLRFTLSVLAPALNLVAGALGAIRLIASHPAETGLVAFTVSLIVFCVLFAAAVIVPVTGLLLGLVEMVRKVHNHRVEEKPGFFAR